MEDEFFPFFFTDLVVSESRKSRLRLSFGFFSDRVFDVVERCRVFIEFISFQLVLT